MSPLQLLFQQLPSHYHSVPLSVYPSVSLSSLFLPCTLSHSVVFHFLFFLSFFIFRPSFSLLSPSLFPDNLVKSLLILFQSFPSFSLSVCLPVWSRTSLLHPSFLTFVPVSLLLLFLTLWISLFSLALPPRYMKNIHSEKGRFNPERSYYSHQLNNSPRIR